MITYSRLRMNTKLSLVIGLMVAGLFPALSLYAVWQSSAGAQTEKGAIDLAVYFLRNSPTYKFDGIHETVSVIDAKILESFPAKYVITISFDSRHAGYGDRSGQVLAQVITSHEIVITVVEGKVIGAVVDDKWDEFSQQVVVQDKLLPPEIARDLAIKYALENHPELGKIPTTKEWAFEVLTPEGLVGVSNLQYKGDSWTVNVSYPVVWKPTYKVEIVYQGLVSIQWKGTVDQSGNVEELECMFNR